MQTQNQSDRIADRLLSALDLLKVIGKALDLPVESSERELFYQAIQTIESVVDEITGVSND